MGQTPGKFRTETDVSSALDFNPSKRTDEVQEVKSGSLGRNVYFMNLLLL